MPDLSIVIVSYNTRDLLRRTLDSIQREAGDLTLETIIIDNGSHDGSADMVRADFPTMTLIDPGVNTWFTGGNNSGIARASGDFVLILNPDTIIQPDMLPTLVDYLRAHDHVGAVTCRMEYPTGGLQRTCSRVPRYLDLLLGYTFIGALLPFWRERRRAIMWYVAWQRDSTRAVEVAPGSCLLARRDLLVQLGGMNTALKLYFPEDDLCQRILNAGYEVHFVADALLLHEEHASVKQAQRLASRIYFDDLITFTKTWYGALAGELLRWLVIPTRWGMEIAQRLRGERDSF